MFSKTGVIGGVKMFKPEESDEYVKEVFSGMLAESINEIKMYLGNHEKKIQDEYLKACDKLFRRCRQLQKEGKKDFIRYIYFFYLNSARITKKHEIQICAYSKEGYMDPVETMELWYPSFIMNIYEKDMEKLDSKVKQKVLRYGYSEYMELRAKCYPFYVALLGKYLMLQTKNVIFLPSYEQMCKDEGIEIVFGGYMDKGIRLYSPMKGRMSV